jgi:hypothetical protein
MRRPLAHWLLALAIATLAPGGYVHALAHLGDELARNQPAKGDAKAQHACELCGAYATADGSAPPPAAQPLVELPATTSAVAPVEPFLPSLALTRFASRAPPLPA